MDISKTIQTAELIAEKVPALTELQKATAQVAAAYGALPAPVRESAERVALVAQSEAVQAVQRVPALAHDAAALVERYRSFLDVSPLTQKAYEKALRYWLTYLRDGSISHPTREDFVLYRDALNSRYKASTVQLYITGVRLFYKWAESEGLYPDITKCVKAPRRTSEHKRDHLTPGQIRSVLEHIDRSTEAGKRDYAVIALAACCGLRACELVEADVADLGVKAGDVVLFVRGKGRSEKSAAVRVPEAVEAIIRDYLASRPECSDTAPLFAAVGNRNGGGRLNSASLSRMAKRYFRAAGLNSSRLCLHSLRHTAVTLALQAGVPLDEVRSFARHQSITTTQIYAHNLEESQNRASRAVAASIF